MKSPPLDQPSGLVKFWLRISIFIYQYFIIGTLPTEKELHANYYHLSPFSLNIKKSVCMCVCFFKQIYSFISIVMKFCTLTFPKREKFLSKFHFEKITSIPVSKILICSFAVFHKERGQHEYTTIQKDNFLIPGTNCIYYLAIHDQIYRIFQN